MYFYKNKNLTFYLKFKNFLFLLLIIKNSETNLQSVAITEKDNDVVNTENEDYNAEWVVKEKEFYDIAVEYEQICIELILHSYLYYDNIFNNLGKLCVLDIFAWLWKSYRNFCWAPFVNNITDYDYSPGNAQLYNDFFDMTYKIYKYYNELKATIDKENKDKKLIELYKKMEVFQLKIDKVYKGTIRNLYDKKNSEFKNIDNLLNDDTYITVWSGFYKLSAMWGFANLKKELANELAGKDDPAIVKTIVDERVFKFANSIVEDKCVIFNIIMDKIENCQKHDAEKIGALNSNINYLKSFKMSSLFNFV